MHYAKSKKPDQKKKKKAIESIIPLIWHYGKGETQGTEFRLVLPKTGNRGRDSLRRDTRKSEVGWSDGAALYLDCGGYMVVFVKTSTKMAILLSIAKIVAM